MSGLAVRREVPVSGAINIPELDLTSFLREPLLSGPLEQTEIPRLARDGAAIGYWNRYSFAFQQATIWFTEMHERCALCFQKAPILF
jgi:hypothetical protein